ncbi:MAG: HisA/HisF-related TIM barrel protein [Candidatus Hodarchaeota archaeon]
MEDFRVVPVIDIKDGMAVHAIKGERKKYEPVNCGWCENGEYLDLVRGYSKFFSLNDLYVADLDAIIKDEMNFEMYNRIRWICQGKIMIDAGITSLTKFMQIKDYNFDEIILGTESVASLEEFSKIISIHPGTTIISLDFRNGELLTPINELKEEDPAGILKILDKLKPDAFIFLELTSVGAKTGVRTSIAADLPKNTSTPIYLGGGIKVIEDIKNARDLGFKGVLLATALQEGLIKSDELNVIKG